VTHGVLRFLNASRGDAADDAFATDPSSRKIRGFVVRIDDGVAAFPRT